MFAPVFEQSYTIRSGLRGGVSGVSEGRNFSAEATELTGGVLLRVTKIKMPHPQKPVITVVRHASKSFHCVCRDHRHFGSHTETNVSCRLRLDAQTL